MSYSVSSSVPRPSSSIFRAPSLRDLAVLAVCLPASTSLLSAQAPIAVDDQVVLTDELDQGLHDPLIETDRDGDFTVVWRRQGGDGSASGVFAQRFDADAVALGNAFQVNAYTPDRQEATALEGNGSGQSVVVWESHGESSDRGILGQVYDSAGQAVGEELVVSSQTTYHTDGRAAVQDDGSFWVVWHNVPANALEGRSYDSSGSPIGEVMELRSGNVSGPAILPTDEGFLLLWSGGGMGFDNRGILLERFASDGSSIGDPMQVNEIVTGRQIRPAVAHAGDGSFAVVWETEDDAVKGRLFHSDATPKTGELQLNSSDGYYLDRPRVAANGSGDQFVVVWENGNYVGADVHFSVKGQVVDGSGGFVGDELQINTHTTGYQWQPDVAFVGEQDFIVVWEDDDLLSRPAILMRTYELSLFADGFETGNISRWSGSVP